VISPPMRAAVYIRKSREDKSKPGYRLSLQRQLLPDHARSQGWGVAVYDDGHASAARGKVEDLKERSRLAADIRKGMVDVVLVIELSRLSRDDSLQDYVAWLTVCADRGVKLATPSRILDPAQHSDWMLLLMEGGFSSVEMKIIRDRMAEGRMQAFRKGKWLGGPVPAPYVYDPAARRPVIDPKQLPAMQQLWRLAEKTSSRAIAVELGMPVISVRRALSDDRLLFYQAVRMDPDTGETIRCDWEPALDADQASRIRSARTGRTSRGGGRGKAATLLSGMGVLRCGYCGKSAHAWHNSKNHLHQYYGCQTKNDRNKCQRSHLIPQAALDEKVVLNAFGLLACMEDLRAAWLAEQNQNDPAAELKALASDAAKQKDKKRRLVGAIAEGLIELADARTQLDDINFQLAAIDARSTAVLEMTADPPDWSALSLTREVFDRLPLDGRRAILAAMISDITLYGTYAVITYRFPRDASGTRTSRIHLPAGPQRSTSRNPKE